MVDVIITLTKTYSDLEHAESGIAAIKKKATQNNWNFDCNIYGVE